MKLTEQHLKKLMEYGGQIQLTQLALNMAVTRFKGMYKANPQGGVIAKGTQEINALIEKFPKIMEADYKWIVGL